MTYRLLYANTKDSDMFHAVKTVIPDACFLLEAGKQKFIFLDRREIGAFKEHDADRAFQVVPLEPLMKDMRSSGESLEPACRLAIAIMDAHVPRGATVEVPVSFPLDVADFLRSRGVILKVIKPFFPERAVKTDAEISAIEEALRKTTAAYRRVEAILKKSSIRGDRILLGGKVLTSEFMKQEVDAALFRENMVNTEGIIVSSGKQAAMPHHAGSGPLLPNEPIICDIFPKDRATGYFADMTRTYVKGRASATMRGIFEAVRAAQAAAFDAIRQGTSGSEVHEAACRSFRAAGYDVGEKGFMHNTGHGLGLDIHESPYLSAANREPLVPGNVVTVEPGLYYEDRGAARIEDVVVVTSTGCRNLTRYPSVFEIP